MIKNINKNKMYYQKYLPGDIIKLSPTLSNYSDYIGMIIKCDKDNDYTVLSLNEEYELKEYLIQLKEKTYTSKLIYRTFNKTSDYYCRWVCKDKDNCELCNYKINNYVPSNFFFVDDRIYHKKYGFGKICSMSILIADIIPNIAISYQKSLLQYEDTWIDIAKDNLDISKIYYRIFLEKLKRSEDFPVNSDIKLYHRKGYTLDNNISRDFCSQCIYGDCDNCEIIIDNIKQKLIEL